MKDIPVEELNEYAKKYCPSCEDRETCEGKTRDLSMRHRLRDKSWDRNTD